ncbi:unnamed protein product [Linum tenue]|uniref:CCHC-type domain-containing protein n=1 Tax=Linum tenue TaxID=586396 RepID=A0AAV0PHR7_9ROSI|nr:unnamed protein product [Linum tenue]
MTTTSDMDDDDFRDIYKEYTGPLGSTANNAQDQGQGNNQSQAVSEEEEGSPDPNAVPTDFTSREAKVWEAKSKATERNWKKRKEEELICKICGESGHFTQGCPSTLGANRKSQDFIERVPAREKYIRSLFTEKAMQRIERDIGCKLKMEEKFIIVSGKDRLILKKGVDAVHKMIKGDGGDHRASSTSKMSRSRSPDQPSPPASRLRYSESQRSHPSYPRDASQYQHRFGRQDKIIEDRIREDMQKFSRGSPQAYVKDGRRSRSSHSKSPRRPPHGGDSYGSYDGHSRGTGSGGLDGWDAGRRGGSEFLSHNQQSEYSYFPRTLEELELDYKKEAAMLGRIHDKEEDEENYKHREAMSGIRDSYLKKLSALRGTHSKQFEAFFHQLDAQRRQQEAARRQMPVAGYSGFVQKPYPDYDGGASSTVHPHFPRASLSVGSRPSYQNHLENYTSRAHNDYGEFQHQRPGDFEKSYNHY